MEAKPNIEDQLREAILSVGMSRYGLSMLSSVSQAVLSFFMTRNRTITLGTAAKLTDVNLRASRQTELEQDFPSYVVAKWIGNSESVARKHYLMLTEVHYQRAATEGQKAAQNPAQQAAVQACTEP